MYIQVHWKCNKQTIGVDSCTNSVASKINFVFLKFMVIILYSLHFLSNLSETSIISTV